MSIKGKTSPGIDQIKDEAKVIKGEKSKDKTYSSAREFTNEEAAKLGFQMSVAKLFDVNAWTDIPGVANAAFELFSQDGTSLKRSYVQNGDFIKIDLPGPLPFYWVKVTEVTQDDHSAQFCVQPTYDPTDKKDDKMVTDHFFQDQARSIFRVERNGREIAAMEIGINEAINNKEAEAGEKGLINTLVSAGGWAIFQRYQWKNLTDYLVGTK
jgi:hypothetical protein